MSWLDHVNGKKHNRNLGMSMRVERATVETVQAKIKSHKPTDRKVKVNVFAFVSYIKKELVCVCVYIYIYIHVYI